jgi:hypothetical protein
VRAVNEIVEFIHSTQWLLALLELLNVFVLLLECFFFFVFATNGYFTPFETTNQSTH